MIQAKVLVAGSFTPDLEKQDTVGAECRLLSETALDSNLDFIHYSLSGFEKVNYPSCASLSLFAIWG